MTLQQLAMFAAVARHRNLTRASEELGKSEPTLSRYLKSMQEQHGSTLFRRASKGVVLTAEGQAFLRRVMPILDQVAALENGGRPAAVPAVPQILRVGGTFGPSMTLFRSSWRACGCAILRLSWRSARIRRRILKSNSRRGAWMSR